MDHEEYEDDDLVVLTDDKGNDKEYIFLALVEVEGKEYAVLTPNEEPKSPEEPAEVFLFAYGEDAEGFETFDDITDAKLYEKVKAEAERVLEEQYEDDEE